MIKRLNVQYAILQVCYWGLVCVLCGGYGTVYLLAKGFTNTQAGLAIAIANLLGVILQPLLATMADASKKISLQKLCAILTGIIMAGFVLLLATNLLSGNAFLVLALVFVLTFAVISTLQGLCNAVSLYYINRNINMNFGLPRGIGSAGFAVLSTSFGYLMKLYDTDIILVAGILLGFIMAIDLLLFPIIKDDGNKAMTAEEIQLAEVAMDREEKKATSNILVFMKKYPRFMLFLLGTVIMFSFHSMCNTYLIKIVENVGGTEAQMGIAQSVAAIVELPVMAVSALLMKKFGSQKLIKVSALFFIVKALGYVLAPNVVGVYATQALQMASYALFIPMSVFYANEHVAEEDMVKGQSLIVVAITISGILASLLGGAIIDAFGVAVFELVELVFAIIGAIIILLL